MNTDDKSVSLYVEKLLPRHISENNPELILFLKAYYDWLEREGNLHNIMHVFGDVANDNFIDQYYELYAKEYAPNYPDTIPIEKPLFIKIINAVYRSKGTPDSIKFFFRALYNENIEILYPTDRALLAIPRADIVIKITETGMTYGTFRFIQAFSKQFISADNGSKAFVENVLYYFISPDPVIIDSEADDADVVFAGDVVFELRISGIIGLSEFRTGARLYLFATEFEFENDPFFKTIIDDIDDVVISTIQSDELGDYYLFGLESVEMDSQLGDYTILNAGTGYVVEDIINIKDELSVVSGTAIVNAVDGSGAITSIKIIDSGVRYSFNTETTNITSTTGTGAKIRFLVQGTWDRNASILTSITDQYQYTIRTSLPERTWGDLLTKLFHPAGVQYIGEIFVYSAVLESINGTSLQLYSRDLEFGGVNKVGTVSSREFFTPTILFNNSLWVYNPFQRFEDENTLFSTDIIDEYDTDLISVYENTPIIAFGTYKEAGDVFDPDKVIRYGTDPYQFGLGTFGEFGFDYFTKDVKVQPNEINIDIIVP